MATFVLLPGAAFDSWYWHLIAQELRTSSQDVVAVDLPVDDDASGSPSMPPLRSTQSVTARNSTCGTTRQCGPAPPGR